MYITQWLIAVSVKIRAGVTIGQARHRSQRCCAAK